MNVISLHMDEGMLTELKAILEQAGCELLPAQDSSYYLRRKKARAECCLRFHDLDLYPERYVLASGEKQTRLSRRELELFRLLMQGNGAVVKKETLFSRAWNYDSQADVTSVEVYMSHLRRKLAQLGSGVGILSVRGVGYRLIS